MTALIKGQRYRIPAASVAQPLHVGMSHRMTGDHVLDVCCFGVDRNGRLPDRRHFLYHNRREGLPDDGIDAEKFILTLTELPEAIQRLVFTVSIAGPGTMCQLAKGHLRLMADGTELAHYAFTGGDFLTEKALVVAELYRHEGWKFVAVGQGFVGGLPALLEHFGAEAMLSELILPAPQSPPPPSPSVVSAPQTFSTGGIYVNRVFLDDPGDRLCKRLLPDQPIQVELDWALAASEPPPRVGAPVQLGCAYRLASGERGVIQGAPAQGAASQVFRVEGTLQKQVISVLRPDLLATAAFFAALTQSGRDFSRIPLRMLFRHADAGEIALNSTGPTAGSRLCVLAALSRDAERFELAKEERYFRTEREASEFYRWGPS